MARVAIDFGTCNTVIARVNPVTDEVETVAIPEITTEMRYRTSAGLAEEVVHVVPSLIHYGESETLIGEQVRAGGLVDHPDTIRWFKRSIGQGVTQRAKTSQGYKSPQEAGQDFLQYVVGYAGNRLDAATDEFTFTAPVEAFEYYENWLMTTCAALKLKRVQLMDEPTACILGYLGAVRTADRYLVFDFGGGTLDVSVVRVRPDPKEKIAAEALGQAGQDLGGMDLDRWLADDFIERKRIDDAGRREFESVILARAEEAKFVLSDPTAASATLEILDDRGDFPRLLREAYQRAAVPGEASFEALLETHRFTHQVRETIDRAIELATLKAGVRRIDLTGVVVTGGTSLVPCVSRLLTEAFGERVAYTRPFDAVVRGACRGRTDPILRHDYALENYARDKGRFEYKELYAIGTEYPTETPRRLYCRPTYDGMTRLGMRVFEVSRMRRSKIADTDVDRDGRYVFKSQVESEYESICLNAEAPTFILADPPAMVERDQKRFLVTFRVDGNRRLLVTVVDALRASPEPLLLDHPVVTLS